MTLVDTSVWIEHFRLNDEGLGHLLGAESVFVHPFVIGELAVGKLQPRQQTLARLQRLPQSNVATHEEVLHLIEREGLFGLGIGYIDAHLLAAARLTENTTLWTHDQRLAAAAMRLGLAYAPSL